MSAAHPDNGHVTQARDRADPRPSALIMYATYACGSVGIAVSFATLSGDPPDLGLGCLLAVAATGLLSFVRHSLLYRSDAARMGWDYGRRNNFQIEVGLANLAWAVVSILAVTLGWGLAVEAAMFLVPGTYMLAVTLMQLLWPGGQRRAVGPLLGMGSFAVMLLVVGILGLAGAPIGA